MGPAPGGRGHRSWWVPGPSSDCEQHTTRFQSSTQVCVLSMCLLKAGGSQPGAILLPRGYVATSGGTFGGEVLLASSVQRPGMLLNIPQCTGSGLRLSTVAAEKPSHKPRAEVTPIVCLWGRTEDKRNQIYSSSFSPLKSKESTL